MKAGETWTGCDGTTYHVVAPDAVAIGQPRWWIDEPPVTDGDRVLGPKDPSRLHLFPRVMFGAVQFALVKS